MSEVILIRNRLHAVRATLQRMLSDPNITRTIDLTPEIRQCGEALSALERLEDRLDSDQRSRREA